MSIRIDTLVGVLLRGAGSTLVVEAQFKQNGDYWTFADAIEQVIRENSMLLLVNDKLNVTLGKNHDLRKEVEAEQKRSNRKNTDVDKWRLRCKEAERELTNWREGTACEKVYSELASFKQLAEEACDSVDEHIKLKVVLTLDLEEANEEIKDLKEKLRWHNEEIL